MLAFVFATASWWAKISAVWKDVLLCRSYPQRAEVIPIVGACVLLDLQRSPHRPPFRSRNDLPILVHAIFLELIFFLHFVLGPSALIRAFK